MHLNPFDSCNLTKQIKHSSLFASTIQIPSTNLVLSHQFISTFNILNKNDGPIQVKIIHLLWSNTKTE